MDFLPASCAHPMHFLQSSNGLLIIVLWNSYGSTIVILWFSACQLESCVFGFPTHVLIDYYALPNDCPIDSLCLARVLLWISYGVPLVCLQFLYVFLLMFYECPLANLWLSSGFPIHFLWFTVGFLNVLCVFSNDFPTFRVLFFSLVFLWFSSGFLRSSYGCPMDLQRILLDGSCLAEGWYGFLLIRN